METTQPSGRALVQDARAVPSLRFPGDAAGTGLAGCSGHVHSPGGDRPRSRAALQRHHCHLRNTTPQVWVLYQVPAPPLISPITLTVLPQWKPPPHTHTAKIKPPLSISYLGGGSVSLKPLAGFQYSFILRKHLLFEAWALAGPAEAWPVQRRRSALKAHYYFVTFPHFLVST